MGIAHELVTRGWCQGTGGNSHGNVCLVSAAAYAGVTDLDLIRGVIGSADHRLVGIAAWNDDPERTFDEVLRVAKECDEILGL